MPKKLIIFGAGETALLAYEYFTYDSEFDVMAFAVDDEFISSKELCGLPLISIDHAIENYPSENHVAFAAMGAGKLNRERSKMYIRIKALGYECVSYVSSRAFVWSNVAIGENCLILEDNTLQPFTEVGNNVVMWSGNHLGHRSVIADNCFVSSHCVISGFCVIGANSFLGVNCTLEDGVKLGADTFVGAGALIRKDTEDRSFLQEDPTSLSKVQTHKLFRIRENAV